MEELPKFTEKEIEELCDIYQYAGEAHGIYLVEKLLLEKHKLSKVNSIMVDIRGLLNNNNLENNKKREKNYPNSTLQDTLSKRLFNNE